MDARTGIEQALLDQISRMQKDWDEREACLTKLVQILLGNQKNLNAQLNDLDKRLTGMGNQQQSLIELSRQLERLDRQLKNG